MSPTAPVSLRTGHYSKSRTSTAFVTACLACSSDTYSACVTHLGQASIAPSRQDCRLSTEVLSLACHGGSSVSSSSTVWDRSTHRHGTLLGCGVYASATTTCSTLFATQVVSCSTLGAAKRTKDCANGISLFVFFPTTFRTYRVIARLQKQGIKNKKFSKQFVRYYLFLHYRFTKLVHLTGSSLGVDQVNLYDLTTT